MNFKKLIVVLLYFLLFATVLIANAVGLFHFVDKLGVFYESKTSGNLIGNTPLMYIYLFSINISLMVFLIFIVYGFVLNQKKYLPRFLHIFTTITCVICFIPTLGCISCLWEYFDLRINDIALFALMMFAWEFKYVALGIIAMLAGCIAIVFLIGIEIKKKIEKQHQSATHQNH